MGASPSHLVTNIIGLIELVSPVLSKINSNDKFK